MRVLLVTSLYSPHVGGVETMTKELIEHYIDHGIDSVMLTKKWPDNLPEHEKIEGIDVYRVKSAFTRQDFFKVVDWCKENEAKLKADIIHVIGARRPMPFIALLLARKWNVPVVVTIAGGDIPHGTDEETNQIWKQGVKIIPEALKQVDCVTAVSEYIRNQTLQAVPDIKNIITLYAGLNIEDFKHKNKKRSIDILSLRRLVWSKGVDNLIYATEKVVAKIPEIKVVIAGDGDQKDKLMELTKQLGIIKNISFLGNVGYVEAVKLLNLAKITVVPSRTEGGGLVNVEAQAAGSVVIATRVDGILEYTGGETGAVIIEKDSPKQLAEKIVELIRSEDLRMSWTKRGKTNAEKFDWQILAPKYVNLYKRIIKNHKKKNFVPWSGLVDSIWKRINE